MAINSGRNIQQDLNKRRNSEPAKSFLWHAVLPDLREIPQPADSPSMRTASSRWEDGGNREIDMALLNTLITDISTPYFSFETEKVTDGSTFWYNATHNDITDLTLTIEEQETGIAYKYLQNWRDMIVNPDGTYNPPHFYKRDIKFYLLNKAKHEFQVFHYKNYFITEVSARSNSYENTEAITYDVQFTGDSLKQVATVGGDELDQILERTSQYLDIDIPYDRFGSPGISKSAIPGVLSGAAAIAL